MTSRFLRFAVLFVLLLLTAQVVQPYIFRLMYSATDHVTSGAFAEIADFLGVLSEGSFGQAQNFGSLALRARVKHSNRSQ